MAITLILPSKRIKIEDIEPNIDNPRTDLGDLTELIDSVKENGVMQNLTVFEKSDIYGQRHGKYTILMGHRRYAAAKAAGLTHLFCQIIAEPSKEEQLHIMLQENIQRNDLTLFDEVEAFRQLHFDLGEPVAEISQKTGLGETTIRRRIKIAELDRDAIKKANSHWQLTLSDYAELEKVEDVKQRNKILNEAYNSNDLKWRVDRLVREAEIKKKTKELMDIALKGCPELKNADTKKAAWELGNSRYNKVADYSLSQKGKFNFECEDNANYYLHVDAQSGRFSVYTDNPDSARNESEEEELEAKRDEYIHKSIEELNALYKEAVEKILIALDTKSIRRDLSDDNWIDMAMEVTMVASGGVSIERIWKGQQRYDKNKNLLWYNLSKKEKEEAKSEILRMSISDKIYMYLYDWLNQIDPRIYNLQPPYIGDALIGIIDTLYLNTSFNIDDNVINMIDGSHELYTMPKELEYEDEDDEDYDEEDDEE